MNGFVDSRRAAIKARRPRLAAEKITKAATQFLSLAISIDREAISYAGPTKGCLSTPEVRGIVSRALTPVLTEWFAGPGRTALDMMTFR